MAWLGVAAVVIFGLVLPMMVMSVHHQGKSTPEWMLGDEFWNSGPLHQVHRQAIGNRCDTCHQQLFQRVQDSACQDCHRTTHDQRKTW
jgi:hypothetical protein